MLLLLAASDFAVVSAMTNPMGGSRRLLTPSSPVLPTFANRPSLPSLRLLPPLPFPLPTLPPPPPPATIAATVASAASWLSSSEPNSSSSMLRSRFPSLTGVVSALSVGNRVPLAGDISLKSAAVILPIMAAVSTRADVEMEGASVLLLVVRRGVVEELLFVAAFPVAAGDDDAEEAVVVVCCCCCCCFAGTSDGLL